MNKQKLMEATVYMATEYMSEGNLPYYIVDLLESIGLDSLELAEKLVPFVNRDNSNHEIIVALDFNLKKNRLKDSIDKGGIFLESIINDTTKKDLCLQTVKELLPIAKELLPMLTSVEKPIYESVITSMRKTIQGLQR